MIPLRINNGNLRSGAGSAVFILCFVVGILIGSATGEYEIAADVSGSNKFTSRSLDGGANGLCTGSNCGERGGGVSGAMWFGPRLGRRRRSDEKTEGFDDDQINAIADALEGSPWNRVSMLGASDKRHTNQFTPRLGRESTDELLQKYIMMNDNARLVRLITNNDDLDQRQSPPSPPPLFAPRLGRHLFTPSPRLGRRLRALLQKL